MEAERLSVVIPTYNRKGSLLRTVDSLAQQSLPADGYEVIVVDDGSTDGTQEVTALSLPFPLRYTRQANSGDAQARNVGARLARAESLVFVDDDITLARDCLRSFLAVLEAQERAIVVGNLKPVAPDPPLVFHRHLERAMPALLPASNNGQVPFTECRSGFMAIRRADFFTIGLMQRLNTGRANAWCDMDFAFRARKLGYTFHFSQKAIGYHHDGALQDLATYCQRSERVSRLAPQLFRQHPDLRGLVPMFRDKEPISLGSDPPWLFLRKSLRVLASCPPSVSVLGHLADLLEEARPGSPLLPLLYRWIVSAHIYQGYRQGLEGEEEQRA